MATCRFSKTCEIQKPRHLQRSLSGTFTFFVPKMGGCYFSFDFYPHSCDKEDAVHQKRHTEFVDWMTRTIADLEKPQDLQATLEASFQQLAGTELWKRFQGAKFTEDIEFDEDIEYDELQFECQGCQALVSFYQETPVVTLLAIQERIEELTKKDESAYYAAINLLLPHLNVAYAIGRATKELIAE